MTRTPRHAILAAALAATLALPAAAQTAPPAAETDMPTQLLFVGNSYLYYGDSLHNHVVRMAEADHPEAEFDYKSATISGAYLDHHDLESHLEPGKLGLDEPFDVVILQGQSSAATTDDKRARFRAAAVDMAAKIEATGARTALYMTPAYTEVHASYDPQMQDKIESLYTSVGEELGATVIPVGLAFQEAYARRPEIALHKSFDGSHPTLLGTYLAAATVYATLYGSPVGNSYTYFDAIPVEDAAFLQEVAADTVAAYHSN